LFEPLATNGQSPKITIRGICHNDSIVKIYLDNKYLDEFSVTNNPSGTTSFTYSIDMNSLASGSHSIYTQAFDLNGKPSYKSNYINFSKGALENQPSQQSYIFTELVVYQVRPGDSLWKIAERYYGNGGLYTKIAEANKKSYPSLENDPSLILPGWKLQIP